MPKSSQITKRKRLQKSHCQINQTQIKKSLKKEKISKNGLDNVQIELILENCSNFFGCYAQDELKHISIDSLPYFLIINFDHSYSGGTHWIALRIGKQTIEIFDPLGFNSLRWPNIPHFLLNFLHRYSQHRCIISSKEIQPSNSTMCGFYCIFFVYFRSFRTFSYCVNTFSNILSKNDSILTHILNKL